MHFAVCPYWTAHPLIGDLPIHGDRNCRADMVALTDSVPYSRIASLQILNHLPNRNALDGNNILIVGQAPKEGRNEYLRHPN